jgi:hypothetical protein
MIARSAASVGNARPSAATAPSKKFRTIRMVALQQQRPRLSSTAQQRAIEITRQMTPE